jgi:sodium/proline symporter
MGQNIQIIIAFAIYMTFMLYIGLKFYNKTETHEDYFLAGRGLGSWVVSMSAQASDMSGWLLMGLPGYAYLSGMESIWIAIGLAIGTYVNWKFVARRLRDYTEIAGNSITIPAFLKNRFRDESNVLRTLSALFILIFFLIYTASGFVASGKLFSSVFGISYTTALLIGVVVVVSYTFMGGFFAVCWTDFFQGLLMFFAVLTIPAVGMGRLGGAASVLDKLKALNAEMLNPFTTTDGKAITAISLISLLAWGLGYFGQPHILTRFMAIRSSKEIKKARIIAMVWVVISLAAAVLIGIVGRLYLKEDLKGAASETVYILMVNNIFPTFVAGIFLSAILAAIMSTADSQLLVTASAITEDFYKAVFRKDAGDKELMWVSRGTVILVSLIALLFALNENNSVLKLVEYAWAGFGATFGPIILFSLFWKRTTKNGAIAGILAGGIMTIIWKQLSGGIFDLYEIVPGFIVSTIAIIIFSLIDKEPSKEITAEFEELESLV